MSRVIKIFMVTLAVMLVASSAFAQTANQRVEGLKGIGYFNSGSDAGVPDIVGVRYWMNDGMAVDFGVGIGFRNKIADPDPAAAAGATTSLLDFAFDLGIPWVMHGEENMIVYFRPGVTIGGIQGFDSGTAAKGYSTAFRGELALGGEFFLGQLGWPNLSFSGQIGMGVDVITPKEEGADSSVSFNTEIRDVSITQSGNLGFHIYF